MERSDAPALGARLGEQSSAPSAVLHVLRVNLLRVQGVRVVDRINDSDPLKPAVRGPRRFPCSEGQIVVVQRWPVPHRRAVAGAIVSERRSGGRAASRGRGRVWARRAVSRRPDHALATRSAALARLVAALEVGRARIALGGSVVPHRASADRAQRHTRRVDLWAAGARGTCRRGRRTGGSRGGCAPGGSTLRHGLRRARASRGGGVARRPDHTIATAVLALEVGRLRVPLPLAIVPHRASALRAAGDGGGRLGLNGLGHTGSRWRIAPN